MKKIIGLVGTNSEQSTNTFAIYATLFCAGG